MLKPSKIIRRDLTDYKKIRKTLAKEILKDLKNEDYHRIRFNLLDLLEVNERVQLLEELERKFKNLED